MKNKNKVFNNGRTNYKNKYVKVKEHILTPEEHKTMMDDYLKNNPIKVIDYNGNVIEEKWEDDKKSSFDGVNPSELW